MTDLPLPDPLAAIGLLDDADIVLDEAALQIAGADCPGVDLAKPRLLLATFAQRLAAMADSAQGAAERAAALVGLLAQEEGFTGDTRTYDAPENADFLALLRRRRGLPVTLAILYVGLARRVGWQAAAVGLPGHVIVRLGGGADPVLIDPFTRGRTLGAAGIEMLVARALGRHARPEPRHLSPMGNRETLVRLLSNQAVRARKSGDLPRALELARRLTLIAPAMADLWWERARLEQLAGDKAAARASLSSMRETTREPTVLKRIRAAEDSLTR
ncbi:MAG: transglutaminase-like domain-containing protein [Sphingomonadaceae bacterium]